MLRDTLLLGRETVGGGSSRTVERTIARPCRP